MLALADVARLLAWSDEPALLVRVPYGPSRGRRWSDLDDAALARIVEGETGGNIDMLFTARREQVLRSGQAAAAPAPDAAATPPQLSLGLAPEANGSGVSRG